MTTDWRTVRLYPIPSIIYLIHNNVQFATLTYVDTSTYQIMGNLKIVTTGILFRWFSIKYKLLCSINTYHFWNSYSHTRADIFYFLIQAIPQEKTIQLAVDGYYSACSWDDHKPGNSITKEIYFCYSSNLTCY